jgi:hypothetical protein
MRNSVPQVFSIALVALSLLLAIGQDVAGSRVTIDVSLRPVAELHVQQ